MAPAADMARVSASAQSFSLANIVPQVPAHNSGAWAHIEMRHAQPRDAGARHRLRATGAVFDASSTAIGAVRQVRVPTVLFKLVHYAASGRSWVHWQQNAAGTVAVPPITHHELVRRLGYDPMSGVAPQD